MFICPKYLVLGKVTAHRKTRSRHFNLISIDVPCRICAKIILPWSPDYTGCDFLSSSIIGSHVENMVSVASVRSLRYVFQRHVKWHPVVHLRLMTSFGVVATRGNATLDVRVHDFDGTSRSCVPNMLFWVGVRTSCVAKLGVGFPVSFSRTFWGSPAQNVVSAASWQLEARLWLYFVRVPRNVCRVIWHHLNFVTDVSSPSSRR